MSKKLFMLPVMAILLFFLSATFFGITVEAAETETEIIASGACGKIHYNFDEDDDEYLSFKADESVKYKLYEDGTMVIYGSGSMGNFNTWGYEDDKVFRRNELIPWYDYREKIRKVVVKKEVTNIGVAAFYGCKNLESIQWTDSVKGIGAYAFYGCKNLKFISWTKSIEGVGSFAFYKCSSLKEVRLPSYVKSWGEYVFAGCTGLKKVSIDKDFKFHVNYIKKSDWDYIKGTEKFFPIIKECDGSGMFRRCTSLEEVKLPKDITVIPSRFVEGCTSLKVFPIPDNITYWGSYPPSLCKGKCVIPDSVKTLGDGAFAGCSGLEKLVLPEGLVFINRAFEGCSSLKTLKIPKSVRKLNETFYNCTGLEYIVIPDTVQNYNDSWAYSRDGIFEGCSNLKSVVLPGNMEYIGAKLFKNCSSLKKVKLPLNLKEIKDYAFEGCSLTELKLPDTVDDIGRYAFCGCTSLKEIDIPKGVDIIFHDTFHNCKSLTSVTLRAKKRIDFDKKVFYGCKNLSKITLYAKDLASWTDKHAFDGIPEGVTIYVPKDCVNKFKKQFQKAKIDMSKIKIKPMQ